MSINRLIISGSSYTVESIYEMPDTLKMDTTFNSDGETLTFYGSNHPLSNMYPCTISQEGAHYNCVEQYLQFRKAEVCGDQATASKILTAKDPIYQLKLGQNVTITSEWLALRETTMMSALHMKFTQNPHLTKFLSSTAEKTLVYANPRDDFWGVGLRFKDSRCNDSSQWLGDNILGQLLMSHRAKISA